MVLRRGWLSGQQAYRAVSWQTVVLVGGLIPLSTAIQESGAADRIAGLLIDVVGGGGPYLLVVGIFVLTAGLGQVISNTATVLIIVPIAVAAALETGVSVQPVLMVVAVAGAASLLTPIATPANLMVMGPGGYRFGDYWRLGLPVLLLWLVVRSRRPTGLDTVGVEQRLRLPSFHRSARWCSPGSRSRHRCCPEHAFHIMTFSAVLGYGSARLAGSMVRNCAGASTNGCGSSPWRSPPSSARSGRSPRCGG